MLTQDQIIAAYEQAIENQPSAGQDVTEASESISRALDDYCTALQYETFLWAYELGFKAGQADLTETPEPDEDDAERGEEEGWA